MESQQLFKALADQTRLRCMLLLASGDELCVCELTQVLGLPQPKVSHHLAALRKAGLVSDRKDGLWVYYRLNPALADWAGEVIRATARGAGQQAPFADDASVLAEMRRRPGGACGA